MMIAVIHRTLSSKTKFGIYHCVGAHYFETFGGLSYCNATYDSYLCWPPTEAGSTSFQKCPDVRLSDTSRLAFRQCGLNGLWLGRRKNDTNFVGWTNYTPCFPVEVQNLLEKVYDDESDPQKMFQIAQNTRYMEIVGFSLSLIALLISLYIFYYFRSLRNIRTKIHRNLFSAMILQVIIRLALYLDQALIKDSSDAKVIGGLDSLPYICEACYISLEYGISAMFCWMFIEGLYLHSIVTANALRECISYRQYLVMGWGTPVAITGIWAVVTSTHYKNTIVQQCWYGYNFLNHYWVCQGPRLAIILINLVFLLNIIRVLIGKLNRSQDSEIKKARKAARAALVLLPLLGITNILNMIEAPLDGSVWRFGLWSYTTHFLRSFQGLFIAFIYCFMNGEVRQLVVKLYTDWKTLREDTKRMRELSRGAKKRTRYSATFQPLELIGTNSDSQCTDKNNEPDQNIQYPSTVRPLELVGTNCDSQNTDKNNEPDENIICSSTSRPLDVFGTGYNSQCTVKNSEPDEQFLCRLYSNSNVLDTLPTIRCDEETNVTDSV